MGILETLRAFVRSERGAATVEACLWIPVLLTFFILILDATIIFLRETDAQRIVQDGTRQYVTGAIETEAELDAWLEDMMSAISPNAQANSTVSSGVLTTTIEYPAEDTDLTGSAGLLGGLTMKVRSIQLVEL